MTGAEVHIAGVIVHAQPSHLDGVCASVSAWPGAEITHRSEDGRAVAVLEATSSRGVLEQIDAIRAMQGVFGVALVYQHAEDEDELNQEMQE